MHINIYYLCNNINCTQYINIYFVFIIYKICTYIHVLISIYFTHIIVIFIYIYYVFYILCISTTSYDSLAAWDNTEYATHDDAAEAEGGYNNDHYTHYGARTRSIIPETTMNHQDLHYNDEPASNVNYSSHSMSPRVIHNEGGHFYGKNSRNEQSFVSDYHNDHIIPPSKQSSPRNHNYRHYDDIHNNRYMNEPYPYNKHIISDGNDDRFAAFPYNHSNNIEYFINFI